MSKALHFLDSFQERRKNYVAPTGEHNIPSNLWKKRMSCWPELIVPLISVPKIPPRLCWETFAQDFEFSNIVCLVGKDVRNKKKGNQQFLKPLPS